MAGSCAEEAIRTDLEAWLHQQMPAARVIHELVVGGCRADVAAVEPGRLSLFEIKSERDTLDRLAVQAQSFRPAAHWFVIVAAHKWFDTSPYHNGNARLAWPGDTYGADVWCHPNPDLKVSPFGMYQWTARVWKNFNYSRPDTIRMLEILWREELVEEARRAGIKVKANARKTDLMVAMWDTLSGKQISEAVCRQLRARSFPRADPPMSLPIDDMMVVSAPHR